MKKIKPLAVVLFFIFISLIFFRNVFLHHQIPFPSNLLASYYQPWASYTWFDYGGNGPPNKPIGFDNLRIFYPLRNLAIQQLKNFQLPLWNPYNFAGNTLLATYQSAIFHPLAFLFLFLPQMTAWTAIVMIAPILAGICMFAFLRKLKLSGKAALFGAITFAFSGFMIVWWEESFMQAYSALFLPLMLLGVEEILDRKRAKGFLLLTIGLVASILSGWFQMTFYAGMVLVIWILYRTWKLPIKEKQSPVLVAALIVSFLISGTHLIPAAEAYVNSARSTTDARYLFDNYLSPISHLATIIAPDFFGNPGTYNYFEKNGFYHERMLFFGIAQFILLLYLLFSWKKYERHERFFLILFIVALSLGFNLPTSWLVLYDLKLPLLSVIIPSRIFFVSMFAASVSAGYGIDRMFKGLEKKTFFITVLASTVSLGLVAWLTVMEKNPDRAISVRNEILPLISIVLTLFVLHLSVYKKSLRTGVFILLTIISLGGSLYLANKFLYFSDPRLTFPPVAPLVELQKIGGFDRFWSYGPGYVESNFATQYRLFSPTGYDSFFIARYGELIFSSINHGKYSADIPRADARLETPDRFVDILTNPYRARMLSLLGVKYILGTNGIEREEKNVSDRINPKLPKIWGDDKYSIYEYTDALPRVFLASNIITETNAQQILNEIYNPKIDLTKTVILEKTVPGFVSSNNPAGSATISAFTPNTVTITAAANHPAILFFSDAYYPGWKAFVDGRQTAIYRADYAFRAVEVPTGNHAIVFSYQPNSFKVGALVSGLGLIAGIGIFTFLKRKK